MQKINLTLYESSLPLEDTRNLWADVDKDTGDIIAIHRYNHGKGEWEPYLVSVDYMKPEEGDKEEENTPETENEETQNNQ